MAASAFKVFNNAKGHLGKGNIDLSSGVYKMVLLRSGYAPSVGISAETWASLKTDGALELGSGGNYSTSGENLANVSWRQSGTKWIFDAQDWSLSANGVAHNSIIVALIRASVGDRPLCYASLSTAAINVASGNKLIVQFHSSGIFTLD